MKALKKIDFRQFLGLSALSIFRRARTFFYCGFRVSDCGRALKAHPQSAIRNPKLFSLLPALFIFLFPSISLAVTKTWTGAVDANWETSGNWTPAGAPGAADDVVLDATSENNVTLNTSTGIASLTLATGYSTGTLTLANALSISGSFTQADGTLSLGSSELVVQSSFNRTGGTFTPGTGRVTLQPVSLSTMTGSTTFYNLRSIVSGTTIYFSPTSTFTVTNELDFQNATFRSIVDGTTWYLTHSGALSNQTLSNVRVQDSNASGGTALLATGTNSDLGNNTNWDFGVPSTITDLAVDNSPGGRNVQLSWSAPSDDGLGTNAINGSYFVQYTSNASDAGTGGFWSTTSAQVEISTTGISPGTGVIYVLTGLTLGDTFYYRVTSEDDQGRVGTFSSTVTFAIPDSFAPVAITDFVATSSGTEGPTLLTWTAPDEDVTAQGGEAADTYFIRFSTTSVDDLAGNTTSWWNQASTVSVSLSPSAPGTTESLSVSSLVPGNTNYYAIRSQDESGNLSDIDVRAATASQQAKAYYDDAVPDPVQDFQAIAAPSQVALTWTPRTLPDFFKYQLYKASVSTASFSLETEIATQTTSNYLDTSVTNGVTYYYFLRTVDQGAPDFPGVALTSDTAISSGTPTESIPNIPVISSTTFALGGSSINWNWSVSTPPGVTSFDFFNGTANISGSLASSVTFYVQTGLSPNQQIAGTVRATNGTGSRTSSVFNRYTLANPPSGSTITSVDDDSIALTWSANGNLGTPTYQIQYDIFSNFPSPTTVNTTNTSVTLNNLQSGRLYYVRIRSLNGDSVASSYATALSTQTEGSIDALAPAAVAGFTASVTTNSATTVTLALSWDAVQTNIDGSSIEDLAGYMVHVESDYQMSTLAWSDSIITQTSTTTTLNIDPPEYVAIRAVDALGNQSADSVIIRGSDLKMIALSDDRLSRMEFNSGAGLSVLSSRSGVVSLATAPASHQIKGQEIITHYAGANVIKSIRFSAISNAEGTIIPNVVFDDDVIDLYISYAVDSGQIVQGEPSRRDFFASLWTGSAFVPGHSPDIDGPINTGLIAQSLNEIGSAVMDATNAESGIGLFWSNGVKWVRVGGTVDTSNQTVHYRTSRLGSYQLRPSNRVGDASLIQVYPRVFTPNGDGSNDVAIFQVADVDVSSGFSGEIYDITGSRVSFLAAGPDQTTLQWDGRTEDGIKAPSGIYVYQVKAGGQTVNGTIVLAK